MVGSEAEPGRVVEGEAFGAPVPGRWPGGRTGASDADEGRSRYGCLVVGGFWVGMIALLWVPPLFALSWAVIGLIFVVRPSSVGGRLTSGSTVSRRSRVVRWLTAVWCSPLVIRSLGVLILAIVAVGLLAETNVVFDE